MVAPSLPQKRTQLKQLPLTGLAEAFRAATSLSTATFGEAFVPGWRAGRFHTLLGQKLDDCLRRKIKRLIISVPPQHGKSQEASVVFPARALTLAPTTRIMQAGHTKDLSEGFSRASKAIVTSPGYLQFYPELLDPRINRNEYWQTKLGGYYYATSVGGGTGKPVDILLIDDPHKDRQEAESKTHRDRVWEWFTSTALTRLAPDGIIIVIQTRWHPDDLAGRLQNPKLQRQLEEAGFEDMKFEVLSLEAICENPKTDPLGREMGQALWPEVRSEKWLAAQKIMVGNYDWNSLYQQRPNPPGGKITDITKIKIISREKVPANIELVRAWDLALGEKNVSDYSAGARVGMDKNGNFYLVHMDRGKRLWPAQKARMYSLIERESIGKRVGIEAVGAWETAVSDIRTHFAGRVIVKSFVPTTDKLVRALPWIARVDAGMFYMVEGDWNQDFLDELEQFPVGVNDDQIDAVTVGWEMVGKSDKWVVG